MNTVVLQFRYSKEEYVSATRDYYHPFQVRSGAVYALIMMILGVLVWLLSDDLYFSTILTAMTLFALSIFCLNYFLMPRRIYERNPKLHEEYGLEFSEQGIIYRSKDIDSALQWSLYQRVQETDRFYFLIYGKDSFTLIPKRAFTSPEQEHTFRLMLKKHVDPDIDMEELSARIKQTEYVPKSLEPPDWR